MSAITFLFVDQSSSRCLKKVGEDTPASPEAYTLNSRPKLKFLQLFFGGTPSPLGCELGSLGSISNACKNLRGQHPLKAEI